MDRTSEPQRIFLRCGPHKWKINFRHELRQSLLEYFEGRDRPARAGQGGFPHAGRESRVPGRARRDELDVADVRSADETVLCDGSRAVRHFCNGAATLLSGARVLWISIFSQ